MRQFRHKRFALRASPEHPARVEAATFYRSPFPTPLVESKGAVLKLRQHADEQPGWIYAVSPNNREGWVPRQWLRIEGGQATLLRDYDATELNLEVGDQLEVTLVLDGWYMARRPNGETGWVPDRAVKVLQQGSRPEED